MFLLYLIIFFCNFSLNFTLLLDLHLSFNNFSYYLYFHNSTPLHLLLHPFLPFLTVIFNPQFFSPSWYLSYVHHFSSLCCFHLFFFYFFICLLFVLLFCFWHSSSFRFISHTMQMIFDLQILFSYVPPPDNLQSLF